MIDVDWNAGLLGVSVGAAVGTMFFIGLGLGLRLALRTDRPVRVLILSAVVRIAALLAVGGAVVGAAGPFAFAGFALGFLITRMIATTIAQPNMPDGGRS